MSQLLIVGAGPAGALAAYLAAKVGVSVTLIERHETFDREFRGEVLMPSALRVFDDVGLTDAWARVPQQAIDAVELFWRTKGIRKFRFRGPSSISQPALLEMLVEEAAQYPGFTLVRGEGVRDVIVENDRVAGVVTEEREHRASFVIGADGRFSTVRRKAGMTVTSPQQAFDVVWCRVPSDGTNSARAYLGGGHMTLAIPAHGNMLQVGWVIKKGAYGDLKKQGFEAWVHELAAQIDPPFRAHLLAHTEAMESRAVLSVVCDAVDDPVRPGLLLIGDASHAMSPIGAQGINVALRDAVVVANHLFRALAAGAPPEKLDAAARAAHEERRPEIRKIQKIQQRAPRMIFGPRILTWLTYIGFRTRLADVILRLTAGSFATGVTDVSYDPGPSKPPSVPI